MDVCHDKGKTLGGLVVDLNDVIGQILLHFLATTKTLTDGITEFRIRSSKPRERSVCCSPA